MERDAADRMRALEDRLELIELEGAYGPRFDARDGLGWAELFTEDGIYQSRGAKPGADNVTSFFAQGRAALASFCFDATYVGIHLIHVPQITLAGDTAVGRVHFEFIGDDDNGPRSRVVGFYDVDYRRVGGRWLFARRVTTLFSRDDSRVRGYARTSALEQP